MEIEILRGGADVDSDTMQRAAKPGPGGRDGGRNKSVTVGSDLKRSEHAPGVDTDGHYQSLELAERTWTGRVQAERLGGEWSCSGLFWVKLVLHYIAIESLYWSAYSPVFSLFPWVPTE
jgi:hypothetical protein